MQRTKIILSRLCKAHQNALYRTSGVVFLQYQPARLKFTGPVLKSSTETAQFRFASNIGQFWSVPAIFAYFGHFCQKNR